MTQVPVPPPAVPSPAPLARLLSGTKYRALAVLGKGAQGVVVEAEHIALGSRVVVKLLHERLAVDGAAVDRMRVEAQALARLRSAHLVPVIDLGKLDDGRPYFVMEKLAGRTLWTEGRARGPLAPAEAIDIARQVLAALSVVHPAGLVHRDIKPANVFLCDHEGAAPRLVKLLDFGIAKVAGAGAVVSAPAPTAAGGWMGTPRFLSPEQACVNPVDGRTDLYSVGALLFWMLTGRDPFAHHEALHEVLLAHVREPPPRVADFAPFPVPAALEHAIQTALRKLPEQRFATAKDFSAALAAVPLGEAAARSAHQGTVRISAGTVRMVPVPGAGRSNPAGLAPGASGRAWGRIGRSAVLRRLVPSLGVVVVVVAACAGLTVLLLLGARLFGWLR